MRTQYGSVWTDEDKQLFKNLMSTTCRCGEPKGQAKSHCLECYRKLPAHMQKALWRRIGDGYREAYQEAAQFLDDYKARFAKRVDVR